MRVRVFFPLKKLMVYRSDLNNRRNLITDPVFIYRCRIWHNAKEGSCVTKLFLLNNDVFVKAV